MEFPKDMSKSQPSPSDPADGRASEDLISAANLVDPYTELELCYREDLCPRGHGKMEIIDRSTRRCGQCGFSHVCLTHAFYERPTIA